MEVDVFIPARIDEALACFNVDEYEKLSMDYRAQRAFSARTGLVTFQMSMGDPRSEIFFTAACIPAAMLKSERDTIFVLDASGIEANVVRIPEPETVQQSLQVLAQILDQLKG